MGRFYIGFGLIQMAKAFRLKVAKVTVIFEDTVGEHGKSSKIDGGG